MAKPTRENRIIHAVPCTRCGARVGELCRVNRKSMEPNNRPILHTERRKAYQVRPGRDLTVTASERGPGRPPGGPGYGGRPRGAEMPCGWGCGMKVTAAEMREHFTRCPKKPEKKQ